MKGFRQRVSVLVVSGLSMAFIQGALANDGAYRQGQVLVKFKDGHSRSREMMENIYKSADVQKVKRFRGSLVGLEQFFLIPGSDVDSALATLRSNPDVEYAQPNYILHALPYTNEPARVLGNYPCLLPGGSFPPGCVDEGFAPPTDPVNPPPIDDGRPALAARPADVNPPVVDPDLANAYGLAKTGSDRAWEVSRGNSEFIVAVIDTGVDYNHPDLAYNIWRNPTPGSKHDVAGYDFIHDDGLPFDDNEHGTHCAGVIGAVGGNGKGISGINQRVSIMALKFLSAQGSGDTAGAISAIDYAVTHGAKVLSNSWGGGSERENRGLKEAILRAEKANVLFIAAAGNDHSNNDRTPSLPASYDVPNIISVAATDSSDRMSSFSNYGATSVHLGAPGSNIYSTVPGNKYDKLSGTSMACPHVAGAAALVWGANPQLTYQQVKARLLENTDQIPALEGKTTSGGRLNVFKALMQHSSIE